MKAFYQELGRKIKDRRKAIPLNQESLAVKVGLTRTSITNIESGRQHVAVHMLYELAAALGVDPSHLLPDKKLLRRGKVLRVDRRHLAEPVAKALEGLYRRITTADVVSSEGREDAGDKKP